MCVGRVAPTLKLASCLFQVRVCLLCMLLHARNIVVAAKNACAQTKKRRSRRRRWRTVAMPAAPACRSSAACIRQLLLITTEVCSSMMLGGSYVCNERGRGTKEKRTVCCGVLRDQVDDEGAGRVTQGRADSSRGMNVLKWMYAVCMQKI